MTGWPWRGFAQNLGYDVEENPPVEKQCLSDILLR